MLRLIDNYSAAYAAYNASHDLRDKCLTQYHAIRPVNRLTKSVEESIKDADWSAHLYGRMIEIPELDRYASPTRLKQLNSTLKAIKREARHTIEAIAAADLDARKSSGLEDAEAATQAASDAEQAALLALCAYRCKTLEEARLKADHLSVDAIASGASDDFVAALLESLRDMEA
ncbi:MAG: hypothetical protein WDN46_19595 [Methylocella sp.]